MVSFCANVDMLFTELPFLERFKAARESGFASVEFILPADVGLGALGDAAAYKGLKVSLLEMPADQATLAFDKKKKPDFLKALDRMIEVADFLECKKIHIPGKVVSENEFEEAREAFVSALHAAAPRVKQAGIQILLGFRNPTDFPEFYPASTLEVLELLDEQNDDRAFGYLFDVYHAQTIEGGLSNTIESLAPLIGHIRIAGVPMREEPDTGEVNYDYLFFLLDSHDYRGHVGCAYEPRLKTADGLKWMKKYV